jgi:glycosyltransferase involved in cell wall biosynthesis
MHIVMLSDWESRGGAAIAASRLAAGLCAAAGEVTRLVAYPDGAAHPWRTERLVAPGFAMRRLVRRGLPIGPRALLDRTATDRAAGALDRALARLRPDVVHLHNLHGGVGAGWSPQLIAVAAAHAPVVWTFHDMWAFTGRCVYSQGCLRFQTQCNAACPSAAQYPALPPALVGPAFEARRLALAAAPGAVAVAPSLWMAQQAQQGLWARRWVEHIPNGVPLDVYAPVDRTAARRALGLPSTGRLALAAMPHLADERKGAAILRALGAARDLPPCTFVTMGAGRPPAGLPAFHLGYVADEQRRALAYAAADVLLHLAPEDNLPNTVVEALACGTPCVALPVGGLPELVRADRTGWLAAAATAPALIDALTEALQAIAEGQDFRVQCRSSAEAAYDLRLMTRRHMELYREVQADG